MPKTKKKQEKKYCGNCKYFKELRFYYHGGIDFPECKKNLGKKDTPVGRIDNIVRDDYITYNKNNQCKYFENK